MPRPRLAELLARIAELEQRIADDAETVALAEWVLVSTGHPIPWSVNAARRMVGK